MCAISSSVNFCPFYFFYVISLNKSFSMNSNTKYASLSTLITYLSLITFSWNIFLNALTYDNCKHSSHVPYFFLSCLMATISLLMIFWAFSTFPKEPEPNFLIIWYFYISTNWNLNIRKLLNSSDNNSLKKASVKGIEPSTFGLGGRCSTIEPHGPTLLITFPSRLNICSPLYFIIYSF